MAQPHPADVQALSRYLPEGCAAPLLEMINHYEAGLKITKPRTSKLGDYRAPSGKQGHRITVNGNLNKFSFLITLVHELAHLTTWVKHRNKVKPHGSEWKAEFQRLMQPFLSEEVFPRDVLMALKSYMMNPAAASCTDAHLLRTLRNYDADDSVVYLEELPLEAVFMLNNKRLFKKGEQLRKRFKCLDLQRNKHYLIHPLAEVKLVENLG